MTDPLLKHLPDLIRGVSVAGLSLLMATPCEASTLPPVDFEASRVILSAGTLWHERIVDASLDVALSERVSLGLSLIGNPLARPDKPATLHVGAIRSTYRLHGAPDAFSYGLTLSAGTYLDKPGGWFMNPRTSEHFPWAQLAFNLALPLGDWGVFRGTLGPVFVGEAATRSLFAPWLWAVPNAELALRVWPPHELTLGGNSLVGWRASF